MKLYMLDMGDEKYGDAIVIVDAGKTILVDGAHPRDHEPRFSAPTIPKQLEEILGGLPVEVSLLVITHCHSDHIGCLPTLVQNGLLKAKWALVAHEDLGYPRIGEDAGGRDAAVAAAADAIVAALREEPRDDLRARRTGPLHC